MHTGVDCGELKYEVVSANQPTKSWVMFATKYNPVYSVQSTVLKLSTQIYRHVNCVNSPDIPDAGSEKR